MSMMVWVGDIFCITNKMEYGFFCEKLCCQGTLAWFFNIAVKDWKHPRKSNKIGSGCHTANHVFQQILSKEPDRQKQGPGASSLAKQRPCCLLPRMSQNPDLLTI